MQNIGQKLLFALCLLGLFSCSPQTPEAGKFSTSTIMNGEKPAPHEYKQVLAVIRNDVVVCSATAIRKKLLFSAAHCFIDFEEVSVGEGEDFEEFDNLFENLGENYCQSYIECLEELNKMTFAWSKRDYLDYHLERLIETFSEDMSIYQGSGKPGGQVEGQYAIKSITLDDGWIRILKLKLYETFNVLTRIQQRELDNITEYDEYSYDYAQVVLKESLKETEIIRPINEDIILDNDLPDGSKVILVGFGSQLSEEESEDEDEEEYEEEEEEELDPNYGVKMKTELPLAGIIINDSGLFAIVAGENHGACEGDSGGAAYIKFPNGKVKYLGIITAGGDRCGESVLWTNGDSSVQGNTIINIKLDPEYI